MKPILISGVQPTGKIHIGNYLGALKNFVDLQNSGKYQCYFFIADLHSLTEDFNPKEKPKQILNLMADFLAAGLDPKKSVIFLQSQISAHSELMWILNTITSMGELSRMTQVKEKTNTKGVEIILDELYSNLTKNIRDVQKLLERAKELKDSSKLEQTERLFKKFSDLEEAALDSIEEDVKERNKVNAGLFDYPVLQAADILLYDAKFVPVGNDQDQHLEFSRTLARKFNSKFGKIFVEPQAVHTKTPRVMSLANPEKKMSKSQPESCLFIDDLPEEIKNKIRKAVTDSGSEIKYDRKTKPAVSNLLEIYSAINGETIPKLENKFKGKNYSVFKNDLAEVVINHFADFRKKKSELMKSQSKLSSVLTVGSQKAAKVANKKMAEVKKKVGLI